MKTNKEFDKVVEKNKQLQEKLEALAGMKGIKKKIEQELKNRIKRNKKNYPTSSSNILQVKEYLKSWLNQGNSDIINLRLQMMWSKIRYFQNLLKFENDPFLEIYGHRLCQTMIIAGAVAVADFPAGGKNYLKNRVIIPISPISADINGNIIQAKTFCAPFFAGLLTKTEFDRKMFDNKIITENGIKGNNSINKAVFFKWESIGITYLWMLLPFIGILIEIINMLQINLGAGMHKYLYKFEGAYSMDLVDEIKALGSRYSNIVLMTKDPSEGPSKKAIETIAGDNKTPPNIFTQQDLAHFMNLMAYFTGEFTNLSEKTSERNINAEVTVNASYFSISQQEFLREAKIALEFYNEKFAANATVDFVYNIQNETSEKMGATDQSFGNDNDSFTKPN